MMARATDRFQLSTMRSNMLQKCGEPQFADFPMCSPEKFEFNRDRLMKNTANLRQWHHDLYLGAEGSLRAFADPRIYDYWTKKMLPEENFVDLGSGNATRVQRNDTLWVMGNK